MKNVFIEWKKAQKFLAKSVELLENRENALRKQFAFILKTVFSELDPDLYWSEEYLMSSYARCYDCFEEDEENIIFRHECNSEIKTSPSDKIIKIPKKYFSMTDEEIKNGKRN